MSSQLPSSQAPSALTRRSFLRRVALVGAIGTTVVSGGLTACAGLEPTADDGIRQLRDVAKMNASVLSAGDIAEFRQKQADVLQQEVVRQCGTFEDGSVPDSCRSAGSSLGGVSAPAQADDARLLFEAATASFGAIKDLKGQAAGLGAAISTGIVFALQQVDKSRAGELTVDTGVGPFQGAVLFTSQADVDALSYGLTGEYALLDNLTTMHARTEDTAQRAAIEKAQKSHLLIRDATVTSFAIPPKKGSINAAVPAPEAGYVLADGKTPVELADNVVRMWRETVERAESPDLRVWATRLMSSAALAAAELADRSAAELLSNPTPGR